MTILNADYPRDWFVERDLPMASKYCDRITVTVDTGDQALVVSEFPLWKYLGFKDASLKVLGKYNEPIDGPVS
jgi:hypothetical protein